MEFHLKYRCKFSIPLLALLVPLALTACRDSKSAELKLKTKNEIERKAAEAAFAATTTASRKAALFAATTTAARKAAVFAATTGASRKTVRPIKYNAGESPD